MFSKTIFSCLLLFLGCLSSIQAEPTNFVGSLKKCPFLNRTTFKLTATWDADPDAVIYRLYYNGELVETYDEEDELEYGICLFSRESAHGYSLSSVDGDHNESVLIPIRMIK